MSDTERERAVLCKMRSQVEKLCCDYDEHLESQQRALEAVQGELRAYVMDAADRFNLGNPDLEYINAYVRVSKELREVYQARISLSSTQYAGSKARFTDSIIEEHEQDIDDVDLY